MFVILCRREIWHGTVCLDLLVHQRTASSAIRPWKGPLPKVDLPQVTLRDFFEAADWTIVSRRRRSKKMIRAGHGGSSAARPPEKSATAAENRQVRLKSLLLSVGLAAQLIGTGPCSSGHAA